MAFDNLNDLGNTLEFLEGQSAQELLNQIKSITLPTKIIAMYSVGSRHFAWIQTTAKIKKVIKGEKSNG